MEDINICLVCDDNYARHTAVVIASVKENLKPSCKLNVYILHDGLSEVTKNKFLELEGAHAKLKFINVTSYFDKLDLFSHSIYSKVIYYRLAIPDLIKDCTKIIYLDSDVVVNDDLSVLYHTELNGNFIGAVEDTYINSVRKFNVVTNKENRYELINTYFREKLDINESDTYFQSGVLLIDTKAIRETSLVAKSIDLAVANKFWMQDQDVINKIYKNKILHLDNKWNVLTCEGYLKSVVIKSNVNSLNLYLKARSQPSIIHFGGVTKPWIFYDCDFSDLYRNYLKSTPWSLSIYEDLNLKKLGTIRNLPDHLSLSTFLIMYLKKVFPVTSKLRNGLLNNLSKIKRLKD